MLTAPGSLLEDDMGRPAKYKTEEERAEAKRKQKRDSARRCRAANPDRARAQGRKDAANFKMRHPERVKAIAKKVREKAKRDHPEQVRETNRVRQAKWQKTVKGKAYKCAQQQKRKAAKLQRTLPWLTRRQLKQIEAWYLTCPIGWHVDHIVPLQGENVCGLHVPWNLQHLPSTDNMSKGNKL